LKSYQIQRPDPKPKVLNSLDDPFGFDNDQQNKEGEQGGADRPATAPDSKPEANEKPEPEAEARPQ
jgi:hypothetical protein